MDSNIDLEGLVPQLEFNPFRMIPGETPETRNAAWLSGLQKLYQVKGSALFLAEENGKLTGLCAFSPLPWDSKLFTQKMGQIQYISITASTENPLLAKEKLVQKTLIWAKSEQYSFLLHKCFSDNFRTISILEKHGFALKSTILNFCFDFHSHKIDEMRALILPDDFSIRIAKPSDEEDTVIVSHQAYGNFFGRFHADERFTRSQATLVYEEWIHSSYHGYADVILVAEHNRKIVGFSIWKKSSSEEKKLTNRLCHLSLGAVDPKYASKGIYNSLLFEGLKALEPDNDLVLIPTQICNYAAQRAYIRLGWSPYDSFHDFHLWLSA